MARDAVSLIKADHRLMERLFEQLKQAKPAERAQRLDEIEVRLAAHSRAEEIHVYPVLMVADPGEQAQVRHGTEEHLEAAELLAKAKAGKPNFTVAFRKFVDAIDHHVKEEETELLPALRAAVDREELTRLGELFDHARQTYLTAAGIAPDVPAQVTKEELYQQAKAADIPGRSNMSKDQLARAVRRT
ncbi:hemerythrin domain-containing protein [Crossiella cryophila]|uniref:Hemerythrin superfamily protein n=1 Tax=Crossiella cryophila TaxID=43355 RepID=A0A7W7CI02_9PSEU|nr:hemerythrin domain-containing protein [Crossiella cryophila]MBB4681612.1 hemerythrin superfamily protein [Crossiella cryophila]